jgi:hypothetical protein
MENASIGTELEVRLSADIKQDAVTTFLQYLYEGFMMLTEENVKHVEKVARLLQVDSVIKCCSDFFKCLEKSTGKPHNVSDCMDFKIRVGMSELFFLYKPTSMLLPLKSHKLVCFFLITAY